MRIPLLAIWVGFMALSAPSYGIDLRPSVKDQLKVGKDAAVQIRKKEKILPAADERVKLMRDLGARLVATIPAAEVKRRPFEYTFDIIESKEVNAFALPGGPIFFYTGLIDKMKTVDELAGVLGHEITHVRNQHWASQEGDRMKRQLPLAVLLSLLNASDFAWDLASLADAVLVGVKYSQKHESEADKFGFDMMSSIGYNPQALADTFKMLSNGKKMSDFDKMLSSHPDPLKRAQTVEARIKKEGKSYPAQRPFPFETQAMKDAKNSKSPISNAFLFSLHNQVAELTFK